jgi:hypothetical protein
MVEIKPVVLEGNWHIIPKDSMPVFKRLPAVKPTIIKASMPIITKANKKRFPVSTSRLML